MGHERTPVQRFKASSRANQEKVRRKAFREYAVVLCLYCAVFLLQRILFQFVFDTSGSYSCLRYILFNSIQLELLSFFEADVGTCTVKQSIRSQVIDLYLALASYSLPLVLFFSRRRYPLSFHHQHLHSIT